MFNLKQFKLVKELKNIKPQTQWLQFANSNKNNILNSILEEETKLRTSVEEMLVNEFSEDIKKMKSYDFLVDSVVNKLKEKQLGDISDLEDIE